MLDVLRCATLLRLFPIFNIGKYAAKCEINRAVRKFKPEFSNLNKSTVRTFKTRYYKELKQATKEQREVPKCIPKYFQPTGRPLNLI